MIPSRFHGWVGVQARDLGLQAGLGRVGVGTGSFILRGNSGARAGSKAGGVGSGFVVDLQPDCSCQAPNSW